MGLLLSSPLSPPSLVPVSGLWVHQQAVSCKYGTVIFVGSLCWSGKGDLLSMGEVAVTLEVLLQDLIFSDCLSVGWGCGVRRRGEV